MRFGLIGDGRQSEKHKAAIQNIGGKVTAVFDPARYMEGGHGELGPRFFNDCEWVVISSPTHCHYHQVRMALRYGKRVICEKPYVLPWQPIIDSPDVNIVMQLRWAKEIPDNVESINLRAVRHPEYFQSWKGNPHYTGGLFFDLMIHYVDLARKFKCPLTMCVADHGEQKRMIGNVRVEDIDMGAAYTRMYEDIVFNGGGVKPNHVAELHWLLARYTERYGFGVEILNKLIEVTPNGLI